jgi:multidrug efflux pump subunit AcrA (membrane-fusion protein)
VYIMKVTVFQKISSFMRLLWKRFSTSSRRTKIVSVTIAVLVLVIGAVLLRGGASTQTDTATPTVTLASIQSFGGNKSGVSVLGTVQSVSEADILAQTSGTVRSVHTTLGASVPAGFVIANLDSAAASAAVLQAQGGYDAALAAEKATTLQSQDSSSSFSEAQTSVRNLYQSTYSSLDSALTGQVDAFFGAPSPVGPSLLINPLTTGDKLPRERQALKDLMASWRATLPSANTGDPQTLLATMQSNLTTVSNFLTDLGTLASDPGSKATAAQIASLASARGTVSGLISSVSAARDVYNAKQTAAAVGNVQATQSSVDVSSAQATVEQALGGLRSAQAMYEKTVVRAPIAGTINFLPIHVGDFVNTNDHVSTVARNNALEVVLNLSQDDRNRVTVGDSVTIEGTYKGIVTSISPALDPSTKQIEVHIAVSDSTATLVNGQSVQVTLPPLPMSAAAATGKGTGVAVPTVASTTLSIQLPLAAVKLLPNERDVFTVDATGHLVAHKVDIGDVTGDRIQILTPLDPSLMIVTDARGFSAGDQVLIASSSASGG